MGTGGHIYWPPEYSEATMELFRCPCVEADDVTLGPWIQTPVGKLLFNAIDSDWQALNQRPQSICRLVTSGFLLGWTSDALRAELLLCRPKTDLPGGMAVDDSWAGMWRLRASRMLRSCHFSCEWEAGLRLDGGGNSGQFFDAQTWTVGHLTYTLGTQDSERLAIRASQGEGLPVRWASEVVPDDPNVVVYTPAGFQINLPALQANELCQVHFVIAWGTDETSPWFMANCLPHEILSGAGCQ